MPVSKPKKQTFILFVKSDTFQSVGDSLKVILTESITGYEESFLFETRAVLTKEEYSEVMHGVQEGDEKKVRECIVAVVEARLKIRTIKEDLQIVSSKDPVRYCAYFLEVSAANPEALGQHSAIKQDGKFDIRNGFRFSLIKPEKGLPEPPLIPQEL